MKIKIRQLPALIAGLAASALICGGCMTTNEENFQNKVAAWVPVGTPIQEAKLIMERHGFRCEPPRHAPSGRPWPGLILECRRENRILNRTWVAKLFLEKDRVVGSQVGYFSDL